jgi:hypothetical protein
MYEVKDLTTNIQGYISSLIAVSKNQVYAILEFVSCIIAMSKFLIKVAILFIILKLFSKGNKQ